MISWVWLIPAFLAGFCACLGIAIMWREHDDTSNSPYGSGHEWRDDDNG